MKTVVVTGVSTGIGYGITKVLINNGICVVGSVRNEADAARLTQDFGDNYIPAIFDITDQEKVKKAAQEVRDRLKGQTLFGLINNAGISVPGPLLYLSIDDFRRQLEVNLVGHLIVTQAFAPLLGIDKSLQGKPGKIINISSVAGRLAYPFLGAYSTSKHGMEAFSDTLRTELMGYGIDVVIIGPGAVVSKIWEKGSAVEITQELESSIYINPIKFFKNYLLEKGAKQALPAEAIGKVALKILNSKKPKLRYAVVPNKFINWTLPTLLPKRFMQWLIADQIGLLKKNDKNS